MEKNYARMSRCANQKRASPSSSSPLSSSTCLSTGAWSTGESPLQPPWMSHHLMDQDFPHTGIQSSPPPRLYQELFYRPTSQTTDTLVPLTVALVTSSRRQSDVVRQSYLGKLDQNHRRYFVLREVSHTGPSRLEWYKNQEKFTAAEKAAGKAGLFGSSNQGVIYLRCCLGVSRISSSRKGHTVALYAKDQTMVLVVEDQREQEEWYLAIKKLMEEERTDEEHGEGFDEDDDGYCTLPSAAFFKEVWPISVKPKGLGSSKSLTGDSRLCLTATSLILVRVGAGSDMPSVTIPLLSVRRFGHLDGLFFLELGRSAPNGPGEIWMEAGDHAQHIHEVVRETVRALRALPDFSRSPTSNHNQLQTMASKRCRPKYRDKGLNVKPFGPRLALVPRNPEIQTSPTQSNLESRKADQTEPESTLSRTSTLCPLRSSQTSMSGTESYMEMKMDHHLPVNKERGNECRWAAIMTEDHCGMEAWEPGEEVEGPGYMMMSPQGSNSSSVLTQDDYVTMTSPQKHNWTAHSSPSSSLQASFNSSTSEGCSPLHSTPHRTIEHSQSLWLVSSVQQPETEAGQSQMSPSCSIGPQDDAKQEQKSARRILLPAQTRATSSPVRSGDGSLMMAPFVTSGPGCTRPVQDSLNSGSSPSDRLQSVRRYRLSLCLPFCLQAEDMS